MATRLEEQDERYRQIGFHPEGDFPELNLSDDDWQKLSSLKNTVKSEGFDECSDNCEIIKLYRYNKSVFREAAVELSSLFDGIDQSLEMDEIVDFVVRDGGEIRIGAVFEPDGMTIKNGWKRLYWK